MNQRPASPTHVDTWLVPRSAFPLGSAAQRAPDRTCSPSHPVLFVKTVKSGKKKCDFCCYLGMEPFSSCINKIVYRIKVAHDLLLSHLLLLHSHSPVCMRSLIYISHPHHLFVWYHSYFASSFTCLYEALISHTLIHLYLWDHSPPTSLFTCIYEITHLSRPHSPVSVRNFSCCVRSQIYAFITSTT